MVVSDQPKKLNKGDLKGMNAIIMSIQETSARLDRNKYVKKQEM